MTPTGPVRKSKKAHGKGIPQKVIRFNPLGIEKISALQQLVAMQKAQLGNPKAARLVAMQTRPLSERIDALQSFHGQTLRILRFEKEIMHTALNCPTEWNRLNVKSKKEIMKKISEKNRQIAAETRELNALDKQAQFRIQGK